MAETRKQKTSRWEWLTGLIGGLLVLATIAFLLFAEFAQPETPPDIVVRADSVARGSASHLLHVTATNRGRETAAAVRIVGELLQDTTVVETSEVTLDYVPGKGKRRGGLFFSVDPRPYRLRLRATGYAQP